MGITRAELNNREVLVGEFNADGRTDLLVSPAQSSGTTWTFHYSKGDGSFEMITSSGGASIPTSTESLFLQDVNGDGITDLIKSSGSGYFTYLIKPYTAVFSCNSYTSFPSSNSVVIPVDINNENYFGRIISIKNGTATKQSFQRDDFHERLLTGSVNSSGVINRNFYRKLSETGSFYSEGSGAVFPYINFSGSIYVPVNREKYYNSQLHEDMDFYYENAVFHKQGLEFRGFGKLTMYDRIRDRELSRISAPYNFSLPVTEESPFSKTTNAYTVNVQSNKVAKITLTSRLVEDKLQETSATANYIYDSYGNPTQETVNFGDGITQTTSSSYVNHTGTPYVLGFLTDQTVTASRNGSSNSRRIQITAYDSLLMPLTQNMHADGNKTSETIYAYNSIGNVTRKSVKMYTSPDTLSTSYEYDSYGRITRETDPLGLYVTYEYDLTTGLLAAKGNHKSQEVSFGYDDLGRKTSASYPDGTNESSSFAWSSGVGLYTVSTTATGKPSITAYYDAFERAVRTSGTRYNGTIAHTDKAYDSYGRLQKESLPFTGSSPSLWNIYSYDSNDRVIYLTRASGKTTAYSYSGRSVTVTEDGIASTQTKDAQGNLISVTDPAGTITYNLRPDGQASSIVAPGNITTSFHYDIYGRRDTIADPSAGKRSFGYDAAGNMNRETDADGRLKSMVYDEYNRLATKTVPEFTTSYAYNSDGQIESETSTNGTSRTFEYDTYGRLHKDKDNGPDGKWIEKTYSYALGNLQSVLYASPSGSIGTEYHTYTNGHLSEIKLGTTSIWKLNEENALGQPTAVATGPVSRVYSYNNYGIATGRTATSSSGGTFQNHAYSFNAQTENLTYRKDNIRNILEDFNYDNLNRLTGYGGENASYDLKGNITQKSDAGTTFLYTTPGKPYALSGVTIGANTAIPLRNQSVPYTSFERPASIMEKAIRRRLPTMPPVSG